MKVFLLKFHDMHVQFEACQDMSNVHSFPSNTLFLDWDLLKVHFCIIMYLFHCVYY